MKKLGIYVHIPFCQRKCKYCGFVSFDNCSHRDWRIYFDALIKEIKMRAHEYEDYEIDTIFIGGGTPTIVPAEWIEEVLTTIKNKFNNCIKQEITIEANPGTLSPEKLEIYRSSGINRLSIGVQSLDDRVLKAIGRIHDRNTFLETFKDARKAGFDNINIDFMFSLPLQTDEIWINTINEAVALRPDHISFYSLQIEEGTEFYEMYKKGELDIADDETDRKRYHTAAELLKAAGYHHYEISNAAIPGRESVHNTKYWKMDEYLGFGIAAHSFTKGRRFYNTSDFEEYVSFIEKGSLASLEDEVCTKDDLIFEYVFTGLRMTEGISLDDFKERFDVPFSDYYEDKTDYLKKQVKEGYITTDDENFKTGRLALTLKGIDVSNSIMSEFAK